MKKTNKIHETDIDIGHWTSDTAKAGTGQEHLSGGIQFKLILIRSPDSFHNK